MGGSFISFVSAREGGYGTLADPAQIL